MDLHLDSGLLPDNLDLSPHHTAFDSFDLGPSSPHYPATPSYNGSYHNSPYSAVSELDFDTNDENLGLFDNDPLALPPRDDYDPSKYDAPTSSGLLMFEENFMSGVDGSNRVSVSITPADDVRSPSYYDHGSPSSSNGGAESGPENDRRSPGSSVSSRLGGINASPHLDFNQLRVESPYHGPVPMPGETASPQVKPQSPPSLVIPDLSQPVINAPEGDGVGPRLHIVPATPVAVGGETTGATGFRNTTISQGPYPRETAALFVLVSDTCSPIAGSTTASTVPSSSWAHHSSDPSANSAPSQPVSEFRSSAGTSGLSFNFPSSGQQSRTTAADLPTTVQGEEFLIPLSPSRTRSKSDTSARPPQWNSGPLFNQQALQNHHLDTGPSNFPSGRTVNMNDVLAPIDVIPRPSSSASAIQTSFSSGSLPPPYLFSNPASQGGPSSYLSPEFLSAPIRRARSDGGGGPRLTHRQSRSEDLRPTMPYPGSIPTFPPSRHVDLLSQQGQFLHPPVTQPFSRGHQRRASSGSRERGSFAGPSWGVQRASPYPASPSSSPARLTEPLPDPGLGNEQPPLDNYMQTYGSSYSSGGSRGATPSAIVARPNVTTSATADASMKRRINDAKFVCPVPGCGSTFTRHFNLKGMRPFLRLMMTDIHLTGNF